MVIERNDVDIYRFLRKTIYIINTSTNEVVPNAHDLQKQKKRNKKKNTMIIYYTPEK